MSKSNSKSRSNEKFFKTSLDRQDSIQTPLKVSPGLKKNAVSFRVGDDMQTPAKDAIPDSESGESLTDRSDLSPSSEKLYTLPEGIFLTNLEPGQFFGHLCLEPRKNRQKELSAFA